MAGVITHRVRVTNSLDTMGDKMTLTIITSEEAIKEAKDYLHSKHAFLNPDGSLRWGCNNIVSQLVLKSFTTGL